VEGREGKPMKQVNHRWVMVDDLMISLTTPGQGPDQLWADFAKDLAIMPITRYLATSIGSLDVNSVQRKLVSEACVRRKLPVAVLTDEKLVIGLVTAVSWLGVNIKPFPWAQMSDALTHLKVAPPLLDRAIDATRKLKMSIRPE
jgi:hypothetical protein